MEKQILGIIPARSGSKGIKNKNIADLNGHPLIYYTIKEALKSTMLGRTVVSTDSPKIAEISRSFDAEVPYLRPEHFATDTARTIDAVIDILEYLKNSENYTPDLITLLQPTAPLRKAGHIDQAINLLLSGSADSLVSLCKLEEPHPYKVKKIVDQNVKPFINGTTSSGPRQLMPEAYRLNGALYIAYTKILYEHKSFFGSKVMPYIMDANESVNIDTPLDLKLAELLLNETDQSFKT
jgi:CMP-N,N'-diacetyllegionaminic acid synthase